MWSELQPWLRPWAKWILSVSRWYMHHPEYGRYAWARGGYFRITSAYRSRKRQAQLYADWRAGRSPIPAAPPGQSAHEYRIAFDIARGRDPFKDDLLHQLGRHWQEVGGIYGGHNFDPVHFQAGPIPGRRV